MSKPENNIVGERLAELSPSAAVAEQIQRALEMMQRVRTVKVGQVEKPVDETLDNRYVVPEPLVLQMGEISSV